jgi:uncharacterized protein YqjF (DUF2071 family)
MPAAPWIMHQRWDDLLFAHWHYPAEIVRTLVPASLELDLWEGRAWVSVVPFTMRGVRARGTPPLPWLSAFPELNVRTYVTAGGKPGVWFFSLDAANPVAVWAARRWFHLPYYNAGMRSQRVGNVVRYRSERTHQDAPPARFAGTYRAGGYPYIAQPGTLDYFLAERYCLYSALPNGQPTRAEVQHPPWLLQPATVDLRMNTMLQAAGLPPPVDEPLCQLSETQSVVVWPPHVLDAEVAGSN